MQPAFTSFRVIADPLIDPAVLFTSGVVIALLAVLYAWQNGWRSLWRIVAALCLLTVLANPSIVTEKREHTADVALVIVDRSPSQSLAGRPAMIDAALAWIRQQLNARPGIELRVRETQGSTTSPVTETNLFDTYESGFADVPANRRAGAIIISDGRVADIPANIAPSHEPIHLLLTGRKDDHDLQIRLLKAPTYGLTGQTLQLTFRIDNPGGEYGQNVAVTLRSPDGTTRTETIAANMPQTWTIPVPYPGQNVYEMTIPEDKGELTLLNNRAVFSVTGVRDRLKVLLVSGEPHAGGRTWRDLFKADSGVDLIHFTILRSPMERDPTPQRELSLIAFPIRELFETKLGEFDLIVLDRFHLNKILPDFYFQNIRNYVENGGALLEVSGPTFGTDESLYNTALGSIFPTRPNGTVIQSAFKPLVTALGKIHPVTQTIARNPVWGAWLQFVPVAVIQGDVLMTASNGNPLLILNHVGKGRIAQLASDQIWLWSRGYDGGGPTEELLRRIVHWLMKEPELEEDALDARADGQTLTVRRRQIKENGEAVTLTKPDGSKETVPLTSGDDGWLSAQLTAKDQGIYEFSSGPHRRMVSYGDTNSPELRDLIASPEAFANVIKQSKGASLRLEDTPQPEIRLLNADRSYGGRDWLGLRQNNSTVVTGTEQHAVLPPWLGLILAFTMIIAGWWTEGRRAQS